MTQQSDLAARLSAAGCVRAEDEAALLLEAAHSPSDLAALAARRVAGEPLEHLVGWAEVSGVRVRLGPGVFVPRRRSEHLVSVSAGVLSARTRPGRATVLDLCAGSGALGLAVHAAAGPFDLVAVDLDPVAVRWAAENLTSVQGSALLGDLFEPVDEHLRGDIALVIGNAPYVPTEALDRLPREAREHEPALALDGGTDGLTVHRRLLGEAPNWLEPGGAVVVELGAAQVPAIRELATGLGLVTSAVPAADDPHSVVVVGRLAG